MKTSLLSRAMKRSLYPSAILACVLVSLSYNTTARAQNDVSNESTVNVTATSPPDYDNSGDYLGTSDTTARDNAEYGDSLPPLSSECQQIGAQRPVNCPGSQEMPRGMVPSQAYWLQAGFSGSAMQRMVTLTKSLNSAGISNPLSADGKADIIIANVINTRTKYIVSGYSSATINRFTLAEMEKACLVLHNDRSTIDQFEATKHERLCNEALVRITEEMGDGGSLTQLKSYLDNTLGIGTDWISWGPLKLDEAIPSNSLSANWKITRSEALCATWHQLVKASDCPLQ